MEKVSNKVSVKDTKKKVASKRMDPEFCNLIKKIKITEDEASKCLSSLEDTLSELNN